MTFVPGSSTGRRRLWALVALGLVTACLGSSGDLMQPDSGGEGTTDSANRDAFGNAARNLSSEERRTFEVGDSFFRPVEPRTVAGSAKSYGIRHGKKFTTRAVTENGVKGVRVWRVE